MSACQSLESRDSGGGIVQTRLSRARRGRLLTRLALGSRRASAPQTLDTAGPTDPDTDASAAARSAAPRTRLIAVDSPRTALALAIVATLPLELTKQWFPVTWIEISRVLMGIGIVAVGWLALRGRLQHVHHALALSILVVLAVMGFSLALTQWPNGAKDTAAAVLYAMFAMFVSQSLRTPEHFRAVALVLCASAVAVALVATSQQIFDFYLWRGDEGLEVLGRRNATFNDPNIAARFLVIGLAALLGLTTLPAKLVGTRTRVIVIGLAVTLLVAGLLVTQSRTGWALAAIVAVAWLAFAWHRRSARFTAATFIVLMVVSILVVPFARARIGLEIAAAPPSLVSPGPGETLVGSRHTLVWSTQGSALQTELAIRDLDTGELVEPLRFIDGPATSDLIGSLLDGFDSVDGRTVRGGASVELRSNSGTSPDGAMTLEVSGLEPEQLAVVTGPQVRHGYDGASDAAPFRVKVRASTTTDLGRVAIVFRFQGLEANYAKFDVTPSSPGRWQDALVEKGMPFDTRGIIDWSRVRRIDIEVTAGSTGAYSGEIQIDDLTLGTVLGPGTYEWAVRVDTGAGAGPASRSTFRVVNPITIRDVRLNPEDVGSDGTARTVTPRIHWSSTGQVGFRILITGDREFDTGLIAGDRRMFQVPPNTLEAGGHYVAQVVVVDENGISGTSEPIVLSVSDDASAVVLASALMTPLSALNVRGELQVGLTSSAAPALLDPTRTYLIAAGMAMFADHPLLGVGIGGFQPALLDTYQDYIDPEYRGRPTTLLHTHAVQVAAEMGLVGLAAYASLVGTAVWALIRRYRSAAWQHRPLIGSVGSALLVILLGSQAEGRFYSEPYLWLFLGLLAGAAGAPVRGASLPPWATLKRLRGAARGSAAALAARAGRAAGNILPPRCRRCATPLRRSDLYCGECSYPTERS